MATKILAAVSGFIIIMISRGSYAGILLLMAIESANIPLPSEIIMPFSGYLVWLGQFNIWWAAFFGAFGCLVGSIVSYALGFYGGRPLIEKFGKYILFSHRDLDRAERWFDKHGEVTVFFSRLLPIVRTYISFPAGVAEMNIKKFSVYTFLGSFGWCLALAYLGLKLGQSWESLRKYFHGLDWLILALIVAGIIYWIARHLNHRNPKS